VKVIISGRAVASDADGEITDPKRLAALDGVSSEDECSNYVHHEALEGVEISGGALVCRFDAAAGQLRVVTEYLTNRKLTRKQLDALQRETDGQWSDGIGEGCFDAHEERTGIHIDPWPDLDDRDVRVEQVADTAKPPRRSPLLTPAAKGDTAKLTRLLDKGEDFEARDKDGNTPLYLAVWNGHVEAARLLLERGANPNVLGEPWSVLTCATVIGNVELVRLLLEHGADVNGRVMADGSHEKYFPLLMACNRHRLEAGRVLLGHGADVNLADNTGYTPLMMLGADDVELGRLLLDRGADPAARNDFGGVNRALLKKLGVAT